MKCIIVEDQPPAQRILQKYIEDIGSLELCATFADALAALDYLKSNSVDLIFLDIHLPKFSGIDFLKTIQDPPAVILTTAFSDYALESYDFEVVDYLLKPFSFPRFVKAVSRVSSRRPGSMAQESGGQEESEIFIKSGYEHFKVLIDDVLFIRSDADYTELVTQSKKYLSNETLRHWLDRLPGFSQVHKSFLINAKHVIKVSGNQIHLSENQTVPIGRAYKEEFMKSFLK